MPPRSEDPSLENTPAPKEENGQPLKQIRTFQGDVAEALQKEKTSIYSIREAERIRAESNAAIRGGRVVPAEEIKKKSKKEIRFIIGTIILLVLTGVAGWYGYTAYLEKTALPVIVKIPNEYIAADTLTRIDASGLDREGLIDAVKAEIRKEARDTTHIDLKKSEIPVTTVELFTILQANPPGKLVRALDSLFMLGVMENNPSVAFLIVPVNSYENAFPGMLEWEASLLEDLGPLLSTPEEMASTTPETLFSDVVINNRDARVLRNEGGETVILYSFFGTEALIITGNDQTLSSIVEKLNARKLVQ